MLRADGLSAAVLGLDHDDRPITRFGQGVLREAAVIGIADDIRGEVPAAYFAGDAAAEDLERVCREQLASFKMPRQLIRVDALPRAALGKVQKRLLK